MLRSIGITFLAVKAVEGQLCNNYDLDSVSVIRIGASTYVGFSPDFIFGFLYYCRSGMGTWVDDVATRSTGGSICSSCIQDYFSTGANATDADTCVNTCSTNSLCQDSCDR
jgi:hypothetical protein